MASREGVVDGEATAFILFHGHHGAWRRHIRTVNNMYCLGRRLEYFRLRKGKTASHAAEHYEDQLLYVGVSLVYVADGRERSLTRQHKLWKAHIVMARTPEGYGKLFPLQRVVRTP